MKFYFFFLNLEKSSTPETNLGLHTIEDDIRVENDISHEISQSGLNTVEKDKVSQNDSSKLAEDTYLQQDTKEDIQVVDQQNNKDDPAEKFDMSKIDINLEDPDVQSAVTKIQAGFRGAQTRKELKQEKQEKELTEEVSPKNEKLSTTEEEKFKEAKVGNKLDKLPNEKNVPDNSEEENTKQENVVDIDLGDPDVQSAATKIQAGFRGAQTRKELKRGVQYSPIKESDSVDKTIVKHEILEDQQNKELFRTPGDNLEKTEDDKNEVDIDLEDPDVQFAATKIQAGFRGSQTRKELKQNEKYSSKNEDDTEKETIPKDELEKNHRKIKKDEVEAEQENKEHFKAENDNVSQKIDNDKNEVDIDLEDPDVQFAATKIQAGFRGAKTRKELKQNEKYSSKNEDDTAKETIPKDELDRNLEKIEKDEVETEQENKDHFRAENDNYEQKIINDKNEVDIDLKDPDVQLAATKIQAGFRGAQTRKELHKYSPRNENDTPKETIPKDEFDPNLEIEKVETEADTIDSKTKGEIDIDLDDPDVQNAATKIQAGFRGAQTRKELKQHEKYSPRSEYGTGNETISKNEIIENLGRTEKVEAEIDIDLEDPDVQIAATKIQAGFRGAQTRKELKQHEKLSPRNECGMENKIISKEESNENLGNIGKIEVQTNIIDSKTNEIDIDLEDPDVQSAATKIQAGFRGSKTRKELKQDGKNKEVPEASMKEEMTDYNNEKNTENDIEQNAIKVDHNEEVVEDGIKDSRAVNEKEIDIDLEDPGVQLAATKIQAGFRGAQTRKDLKQKVARDEADTLGELETKNKENNNSHYQKQMEMIKKDIDIDLEDPDVQLAATKIQAGFRGAQTRKELKQNEEAGAIDSNFNNQIDIDLEDPDVKTAATKIQAGFRGSKTRRELKRHQVKDIHDNLVSNEPENKKDEEIHETNIDENNFNNQNYIDIDLEDPDVQSAATKIQAGFRGAQTRKELRRNDNIKETSLESQSHTKKEESEEAAVLISKSNDLAENDNEHKGQILDKTGDVHDQKFESNEIDIDLEDPDVKSAATKIQAGFRGAQTRKEFKQNLKNFNDHEIHFANQSHNDDNEADVEDTKTKYKNEIDIDLEGPDVESAATKIQAGFRGAQTRKGLKNKKHEAENKKSRKPKDEKQETEQIDNDKSFKEFVKEDDNEIDINLDDHDVQMAATKIQAGYRGLKTRKELKKHKIKENEEKSGNQIEESEEHYDQVTTDVLNLKTVEEADGSKNVDIDIDLTDPKVDIAATKIQAGFRGSKVRRNMNQGREIQEPSKQYKDGKYSQESKEEQSMIDIDLDDPEVKIAATKIQAGFRGARTRQGLQLREDNEVDSQINIEANDIGKTSGTDVVDIDLNDPDVEMAATKIQAGFRGSKVRQEMNQRKLEKDDHYEAKTISHEIDIDLTDPDVEMAATKIQAGFRGSKVRQKMNQRKLKNEDNIEKMSNEVDIDLNDPEVEMAATKIQAGFRGIKTRKELSQKKDENDKSNNEYKVTTVNKNTDDIDLTNPEVEMAATKIQAGFRGVKTRKELAKNKGDKINKQLDEDDEDVIMSNANPEMELAATKIQAGFKGMKARKQVTELKRQNNLLEDSSFNQNPGEESKDMEAVVDKGDAIQLDDEELEQAATKIQAGFKGMKARKEIEETKRLKEAKDNEQVGSEITNEGTILEDASGLDNNDFPVQDDGYISPPLQRSKNISGHSLTTSKKSVLHQK